MQAQLSVSLQKEFNLEQGWAQLKMVGGFSSGSQPPTK